MSFSNLKIISKVAGQRSGFGNDHYNAGLGNMAV